MWPLCQTSFIYRSMAFISPLMWKMGHHKYRRADIASRSCFQVSILRRKIARPYSASGTSYLGTIIQEFVTGARDIIQVLSLASWHWFNSWHRMVSQNLQEWLLDHRAWSSSWVLLAVVASRKKYKGNEENRVRTVSNLSISIYFHLDSLQDHHVDNH